MTDNLAGKVALITGAGKRSGIGYAIAAKFAKLGADIVIADLGFVPEGSAVATGTREEMEDIVSEFEKDRGVKALAVDLDVSKPESVAAMAGKVGETFGNVDILVNNAGASFGVPNMVSTYDEEAWIKTVDINLHGVFRVCKAVLPMMFGREGASIINTSSRAGKTPPIFNGAYAVAKSGVIMLTKVLAREVSAAGIRVNAICPGQIMTDLEQWRFSLEAQAYGGTVEDRIEEMCKTVPLGRIGTTEDVAETVAWLASPASAYITGQAINICGGQTMEL